MTTADTLQWSEELVLGDARTDHTHEEMVELMNATTAAAPEDKLAVYQKLLAHTVEHFAQEERWMLACGVSPDFCHFSQHKNVLEVMEEVERRALAGEPQYIGNMIEALVEWLPAHATTMDSSLVAFLKERGYNTEREAFIQEAQNAEAATVELSCSVHAPSESCA